VEVAGAAFDVHDAQLVEPGGDGGLGERPPELAQDILPNVGNGVQKGNTSLSNFTKHLFIITEKEAYGNTYSNNKRRILNRETPPRARGKGRLPWNGLFSASDRFLTSPGDSLIIFLCGMDNFADGQETNLVKIHQKEQGTFIKGGASLWTS
jgi:hypothetical protein